MNVTARPTCAVCLRPVEQFTEEEDAFREKWILVAVCHGERERVVIDFDDVKSGPITMGLAFAGSPRRLASSAGHQAGRTR